MNASVRLVAIVTDNEAVNKALYLPPPPQLALPAADCLRCSRHLASRPQGVEAASSPWLRPRSVRHAACLQAQQALSHRHQRRAGCSSTVLQILSIVVTRWNSLLFAAERVLELEDCIKPCIPKINTQLSREKKRGQLRFLHLRRAVLALATLAGRLPHSLSRRYQRRAA